MSTQILNITLATGNDLTLVYTQRYRLKADADVDANYTTVTNTINIASVIMPNFDSTSVPNETYIVHTYVTAEGTSSGSKMEIFVDNEIAL